MSNKLIIKITLFSILMLFAPSLYYILVAIGFLPAIFYLFFIVGSGELFDSTMWAIHLLIYSVIFIAISFSTIEFIYKISDANKRNIVISILFSILIFSSLLPIYTIGGHSNVRTTNIFGVYKSAGNISYLPW